MKITNLANVYFDYNKNIWQIFLSKVVCQLLAKVALSFLIYIYGLHGVEDEWINFLVFFFSVSVLTWPKNLESRGYEGHTKQKQKYFTGI